MCVDNHQPYHALDSTRFCGWAGILRADYWAVVGATTVGYGDIVAVNTVETVYSIIFIFFGGLFKPAVVGGIAALIISRSKTWDVHIRAFRRLRHVVKQLPGRSQSASGGGGRDSERQSSNRESGAAVANTAVKSAFIEDRVSRFFSHAWTRRHLLFEPSLFSFSKGSRVPESLRAELLVRISPSPLPSFYLPSFASFLPS